MKYGVKNIAFDNISDCVSFFQSIIETLQGIGGSFRPDMERFSHCSFRKPDGETIKVYWKGDPGDEIICSGTRYSPADYQQQMDYRIQTIERKIDVLLGAKLSENR